VTLDTICRWRGRTSFEDRSHTALQLATTMTRPQEPLWRNCAGRCCWLWMTCWR
jgi:hypothetical protein